ncbi:MAG: hypothetical protein ACI84D_002733, partial [Thalassolituus oleivorans]
QQLALSVEFTPGASGVRSATLTVTSNDAAGPLTLPLSGTGTLPGLSLTPLALAFGAVELGQSASLSTTVENTGDADLQITGVTLGGTHAADMAITAGGLAGTLTPGQQRTITVEFTPGATGARTATLTVTSNDLAGPTTVPLSGTGTAPALRLTPRALVFPAVEIGQSSTLSTTAENTGDADLQLRGVTLSGGHASDMAVTAGGLAGTLSPGQQRVITVRFTPGATGSRVAQLEVDSNAPGGTASVALSGAGKITEMTVSPEALDFQDVEVGEASTLFVTIANTGTATVSLGAIGIVGEAVTEFSISGGGTPGALSAGQQQTVAVTFTPTTSGRRTASLSITSQISGTPVFVSLFGSGTVAAAALEVAPLSLEFGQVLVGGTSDLTTHIQNTGTAELNLLSLAISGGAFSIVSGGGTGALPAGTSRSVVIRFTPTGRASFSGALDIVSSVGTSRVTFDGRGAGPDVSAAATLLNFGSVEVGALATRTVVLSNLGETEATISLLMGGADAAAFTAALPSHTLAAGQQVQLSVAFVPQRVGAHVATIAVGSTPFAVPISISVSGSGTVPSIIGTAPEAVSASLGNDVPLTVELSSTFQPQTRELCYRQTGQATYVCVPLVQSGTLNAASVPAAAVTVRGVEYFFRFTDAGSTYTDPADQPDLMPYRLSVLVDAFPAPVPILPKVYRMISVPLQLANPQAESVLAALGPPDPFRWRLQRWNGATQQYGEHPNTPAVFTPCTAFWLVTIDGATFDITLGSSVDALEPCDLDLFPGWNQIASPYAFPISWSDVELSAPVDAPVHFDASTVGDDPYRYNQAVLQPWDGYWVNNPTSDVVSLAFQPIESSATSNTSEAAAKNAGIGGVLDRGGYAFQLTARMPLRDLKDAQNFVGAAETATDGYDALDFAEAPGIGEYVRLSIVEHDRRMAGDFKQLRDTGSEWHFEVGAELKEGLGETGQQVVVSLSGSGSIPAGQDPYVFDLDRGERMWLSDGSFHVTLTQDEPVRHFSLLVGTQTFASQNGDGISLVPQRVALEQNYPNPFESDTRIRFQLPEGGHATLNVYNSLGQRIRTLVDGTRGAGWFEATWDGRDNAGYPVTSGLYFYRLEAPGRTMSRFMVLVR